MVSNLHVGGPTTTAQTTSSSSSTSTPTASPSSSNASSDAKFLGIGIAVALIVIIVVVLLVFLYLRISKKRASHRTESSAAQQTQSGDILGSQGIANPLYNNAAFGADAPSYEDFQEPASVDARTPRESIA
jgi:beta-lactamase regulating signal transducer with metallopeptidase domain